MQSPWLAHALHQIFKLLCYNVMLHEPTPMILSILNDVLR
jgi:hypothetical protein